LAFPISRGSIMFAALVAIVLLAAAAGQKVGAGGTAA
jgi:hypothetical protein